MENQKQINDEFDNQENYEEVGNSQFDNYEDYKELSNGNWKSFDFFSDSYKRR